ncbi:MAG: glycosyltransferase family 4 protein [Pseudomonadota bacterium]
MTAPRVAFYAPMKPPDHPVPSGDRTIARLLIAALERAGFDVDLASRLRILDKTGDAAQQAALTAKAAAEASRLIAAGAGGAAAWLTYHSHYRAPDLIGAAVTRALGLPYAIVEPSISPKRRDGPWAGFSAASDSAIADADRLFWTTGRDRPALEAAGHGARMTHLPAFVDPGPPPPERPPLGDRPAALIAVAMMRDGDKLESYRRLARALAHLSAGPRGGNWGLTVVGDGPMRDRVEALFVDAAQAARGGVVFRGAEQPAAVRRALDGADAMVWPGVGEGVGYAWLEAAAAGLPTIAEDGPAARDVVQGMLVPPDDPLAFAHAIEVTLADRDRLGRRARDAVLARHTIDAAATTLGDALTGLIEAR